MADDGLPTALFVEAHLRQLTAQGVPFYIVQKGAYGSGTVLLKINQYGEGCRVLQQQRDLDGVLGWMAHAGGAALTEAEVDAYIARAINRDPDLWVIEIEDREGKNPFEGKVF